MSKKLKLTPERLKQIIKEEKAKLNLSESKEIKNKKINSDKFESYEKLIMKESKLLNELKKILIAKKKMKEIIRRGK